MTSRFLKHGVGLVLVLATGAAAQGDARKAAELSPLATTQITVALTPVTPDSAHRLRWSPKGALVPLHLEAATLRGSFTLGPAGAPPVAVRLEKVGDSVHYNTLWIDLNRDGRFSDDERFTAKPTLTNYKWWSSFNAVPMTIPVPAEAGSAATTRAYPINLWFVEDPADEGAPPALRWSRSGWHIGQAQVGGQQTFVLITEMEQDGIFDQRDSWAMSRNLDSVLRASPRPMDTHAWLDGVAYRPVAIDPNGRSISFAVIRPATTEAEELAKADIYAVDRNAPRAAKPVAFSREFAAGLAEASRAKARVLLAFDATWCGPCHTMDQLVYTSSGVATAAQGIVAIKVDGDEHPDIKKRYKVEAFPTMILLDANGKEIRRLVGYEGVAEMVAFLKPNL